MNSKSHTISCMHIGLSYTRNRDNTTLLRAENVRGPLHQNDAAVFFYIKSFVFATQWPGGAKVRAFRYKLAAKTLYIVKDNGLSVPDSLFSMLFATVALCTC